MGKTVFLIGVLGLVFLSGCNGSSESGGWVPLFNGTDLSGWKASENQGSFKVEDGAIIVHGKRSHLFYAGPVGNASFKDFEFSAQVMTTAGSNSGIYFHTEYQQEGWPKKGYESQINISHSDPQKSGGLYGTVKVSNPPVGDNEWYTQYIKVEGKNIILKTNGQALVNYVEAEDVYFEDRPGRRLSSGTIAIQAHDPKSLVYVKDIKVKLLK